MSVTFSTAEHLENGIHYRESEYEVNLANGNAVVVLDALGLDSVDLMGSCSAFEFLGRVTYAQSVLTDLPTARPTVESGGPGTGQARMISIGFDVHYLPERLDFLQQLGVDAVSRGMIIAWA